jgi:hypothetical protein
MSWRLDLRIVLATIWIVLTQNGAVPDINGPLLPLDVQRENALTAVANSSGIER